MAEQEQGAEGQGAVPDQEIEVREADGEAVQQAARAFGDQVAKERSEGRHQPRADLLALVATLAGQALAFLGRAKPPTGAAPTQDLAQARYVIDLLGCLEEKTRGNRTEEEERVFLSLLTDLRLSYVRAC